MGLQHAFWIRPVLSRGPLSLPCRDPHGSLTLEPKKTPYLNIRPHTIQHAQDGWEAIHVQKCLVQTLEPFLRHWDRISQLNPKLLYLEKYPAALRTP